MSGILWLKIRYRMIFYLKNHIPVPQNHKNQPQTTGAASNPGSDPSYHPNKEQAASATKNHR
jgi:hypothetical protein